MRAEKVVRAPTRTTSVNFFGLTHWGNGDLKSDKRYLVMQNVLEYENDNTRQYTRALVQVGDN